MKTFITFYKFLLQYKAPFFISVIFSLIAILFTSSIPFIFRYLADNLGSLDLKMILFVILLFFTARMGAALTDNLSIYTGDKVIIKGARDARLAVFSHLQKLDFAFHINKRSGEFISKIKRGDGAFFDIFTALNREVLTYVFNFLAIAFSLSYISKNIIFTLLGALFLIIFSSMYLLNKNIAYRVSFNKEEDNISHLIIDNLINYETVKYFAKEKREIRNLTQTFRNWESSLFKYVNTFRKINIIVTFITTAVIAIILYIAGAGVINRTLTPGDLILTITFILQFFPKFESIIGRIRNVVKHYSDLKDYFEILDYPLVMPDPENPEIIKNASLAAEIEFKNVFFAYPSGQDALHNINLKIQKGTAAAFVGRSGSGKTTLTRLLLRVYDPLEGAVEINGRDLRNLKKEDLRKMIGIVPQEPILFNNTIAYNIAYPSDNISKDEIITAAKLANLHDFISGLPKEYNTVVGERGVKLSGGEKQRLAIARVFLLNPGIIIFDEATSHLDSESEHLIQKSIERLAEHKTLLIVAHRLSTIMRADKIIVLEKGRIKETGIHSELISKKRGIYKLLWSLQTEGAVA